MRSKSWVSFCAEDLLVKVIWRPLVGNFAQASPEKILKYSLIINSQQTHILKMLFEVVAILKVN